MARYKQPSAFRSLLVGGVRGQELMVRCRLQLARRRVMLRHRKVPAGHLQSTELGLRARLHGPRPGKLPQPTHAPSQTNSPSAAAFSCCWRNLLHHRHCPGDQTDVPSHAGSVILNLLDAGKQRRGRKPQLRPCTTGSVQHGAHLTTTGRQRMRVLISTRQTERRSFQPAREDRSAHDCSCTRETT